MVPMPQMPVGGGDEVGGYLFALWSLWPSVGDGRGFSVGLLIAGAWT